MGIQLNKKEIKVNSGFNFWEGNFNRLNETGFRKLDFFIFYSSSKEINFFKKYCFVLTGFNV